VNNNRAGTAGVPAFMRCLHGLKISRGQAETLRSQDDRF